MKRLMFLALLLMLVIFASFASAKEGHMKLLAVTEYQGKYAGSTADLFLEIKDGSGRVFIDTYPLTKMDTQISTRFANQIACDYLDFDCDKYDFIYTIRADSAIIGGPSAGTAITILTISMLGNYKIDEKTAITGTINSGGLIGPIGGLKDKLGAGAKDNLTTILIPKGERFLKEGDNTTDLQIAANQSGVKLIEVSDLDEALEYFTGKKFLKNESLVLSGEYTNTMKNLADSLCNRSESLKESYFEIKKDGKFESIEKDALNASEKGKNAIDDGKYYSAASYCFGANVKYSTLILRINNLTKENAEDSVGKITLQIMNLNKKLKEYRIKTLTDLQTYMVVSERLKESQDSLMNVKKYVDVNDLRYVDELAYGVERFYSALSWAEFFGKDGKEIILNKDALKESCKEKILEAQERLQYVNLYVPNSLESSANEIGYAQKDMSDGNYELCLFKATKAKAEADLVLSSVSVEIDRAKDLFDNKMNIVRKVIARSANKGMFPIVGYSYYEYAEELRDIDVYSALLYSEYALEMSNFNIYFKEEDKENIISSLFRTADLRIKLIAVFVLGLIFGMCAVFIIRRHVSDRNKRILKKQKKA